MAEPREGTFIWVTWLPRLLAGDAHCVWAAWFRAHYRYDKRQSEFDFSLWRAQHAELVRRRAGELRGSGYEVYIEEQNRFRLKGKVTTLGGAPDIVAVRGAEALVVDCKAGESRDSDRFQVLLYMYVLPFVHPACRHRTVAGEVHYKDGRILTIEPAVLGDQMKDLFRHMIEQVGGDTPPSRVPSFAE